MGIELSEEVLQWIHSTIKNQFPASKVYLFGSRIRNMAHANSDVDIAIDQGKPLSLLDLATIQDVFQESDLSIRIDISDWHRLSPAFQKIIQETGLLLSN